MTQHQTYNPVACVWVNTYEIRRYTPIERLYIHKTASVHTAQVENATDILKQFFAGKWSCNGELTILFSAFPYFPASFWSQSNRLYLISILHNLAYVLPFNLPKLIKSGNLCYLIFRVQWRSKWNPTTSKACMCFLFSSKGNWMEISQRLCSVLLTLRWSACVNMNMTKVKYIKTHMKSSFYTYIFFHGTGAFMGWENYSFKKFKVTVG